MPAIDWPALRDYRACMVGLADSVARPWTYEKHPTGTLVIAADRERQVLVGPGRWLRLRASGSTSSRSPSGPRSPSTSWSTRSPSSPPIPRPT
jgi:hypothetical protein